jgi:hypothetical protein
METICLHLTDDGLTLPDTNGDEVLAAMRWRDLDADAFSDHLLTRLMP